MRHSTSRVVYGALSLVLVATVAVITFAVIPDDEAQTVLIEYEQPSSDTADSQTEASSQGNPMAQLVNSYTAKTDSITSKVQDKIQHVVSPSRENKDSDDEDTGSAKKEHTERTALKISAQGASQFIERKFHSKKKSDTEQSAMADYEATLKKGKSSSSTDSNDELLEVPDDPAKASEDEAAKEKADKKKHEAEEKKKEDEKKLEAQKEKEKEKELERKKKEAEKAAAGVRLTHTGEHDLKRAIARGNGRVHRHYLRGKAEVWDSFSHGVHHLQESPGGRAAIRAARSIRSGASDVDDLQRAEAAKIQALKTKTADEEAEIRNLRADDDDAPFPDDDDTSVLLGQYEGMMQKLDTTVEPKEKSIPAGAEDLSKKKQKQAQNLMKEMAKFEKHEGPNPIKLGPKISTAVEKPATHATKAATPAKAATHAGKAAPHLAEPDIIQHQAAVIAKLKKRIAELKGDDAENHEESPPPVKEPTTAQVIAADASTKDLYHTNAAKDFAVVHKTMMGVHQKEWSAEAKEEKEVHDAKHDAWQDVQKASNKRIIPEADKENEENKAPLWGEVWNDYEHPSPSTKPIRDRLHLVHPMEDRTGFNGAQGIRRTITKPSSTLVLPGENKAH